MSFPGIVPVAVMTCAPAAMPAPSAERRSCPALLEILLHSLEAFVQRLLCLAEREANERSAIRRIVVKRAGWNRRDPDSLDEVAAERHIAFESKRRVIDHDEIRTLRRENRE